MEEPHRSEEHVVGAESPRQNAIVRNAFLQKFSPEYLAVEDEVVFRRIELLEQPVAAVFEVPVKHRLSDDMISIAVNLINPDEVHHVKIVRLDNAHRLRYGVASAISVIAVKPHAVLRLDCVDELRPGIDASTVLAAFDYPDSVVTERLYDFNAVIGRAIVIAQKDEIAEILLQYASN